METAVHESAIALFNSGRPFDGGLFRLIGEQRLLQTLTNNGTGAALDALLADLPGRVFAGGSLAMLILAIVSSLLMLLFGLCIFGCAWRTVRRDREERSRPGSYASMLALRRRQIRESGRAKSVSCSLAVLCLLLLIVTLMPLILASAANFRLHYSLTAGSDGHKEDSLSSSVDRLLGKVDAFMAGLGDQIRSEAAPVILEAQRLTDQLKSRAQVAYETAFKQSTGAAQLLAVSDELLRRMSDFYYSGKNLSIAMEMLQSALSDLKNVQFFAYEDTCRKYYNGTDNLCSNHSQAAMQLVLAVQAVRNDWTTVNASSSSDKRQSSSLETHAKNITKLVYQLVGALDGSRNTPARQQEIRRQKLRVGDEMNANISAVFDRELNSTAFLIDSIESQLIEMEVQLSAGREGLGELRKQFSNSYTSWTSGPESARFGITLFILMLFFISTIALATGVTPFVLKSIKTGSRTRYFVGTLYLCSFILIGLAIVLNAAMSTATAFVQAEACRYLWDTQSSGNQSKADEFLVPEVNGVLAELRARSAGDPNATEIPITAVGSIQYALQHSCKSNLPLLTALGADRYIDEAVLDKTVETKQFQAKGLAILIREMQAVNLDQLRDEKVTEDLQNLKPFFRTYTSTDFVELQRRLKPRAVSAAELEVQLNEFSRLNERVDKLLPESESSVKQLSTMNSRNAARSLLAVDYLRRYANEVGGMMLTLEAEKDVNAVIDEVIVRNQAVDVYLLNRTLWVQTAASEYKRHIMLGTLAGSVQIGKHIGAKFLSSVVRCGSLHQIYADAVRLPCSLLLQPLSIQCFCIGWLLCSAFVLALVTMAGFCRSHVWLTGIAALRRIESALTGDPEAEHQQLHEQQKLQEVAEHANGNGHVTNQGSGNASTAESKM